MPALDSSKRQARGIFTSSSYVPWTCQYSIGILRQTCMILKQKLHLLILIPTWRKHVYMRDLRFVLRYCRKFQITEDRCLNWRTGNRFYGHMLKGQETRKWKLVDDKLWSILFLFLFWEKSHNLFLSTLKSLFLECPISERYIIGFDFVLLHLLTLCLILAAIHKLRLKPHSLH